MSFVPGGLADRIQKFLARLEPVHLGISWRYNNALKQKQDKIAIETSCQEQPRFIACLLESFPAKAILKLLTRHGNDLFEGGVALKHFLHGQLTQRDHAISFGHCVNFGHVCVISDLRF